MRFREVTREELNSLVDKAADLIRTAVDYKFILVLLFFKRTNDLWTKEKEEAKRRLMDDAKLAEKEAEEAVEKPEDFYTFNIPKQFL